MAKRNLLFKETEVKRAVRSVRNAGLEVDRVLIDRQGNIAVIAKSSELPSAPLSCKNEWDELLNGKPAA